MKKEHILKYLDLGSYSFLINAVLFAVLFQYSAARVLLFISIISFILAFLLSIVFSVCRIIFDAKYQDDFKLTKKQKVYNFVKLFFSVVLFGFSVFISFYI